MTISVLQERETSTSASVSSLALAFSSNLTAASSIHAVGTSNDSNASFTCADTANGSYGAALDNIDAPGGADLQRAAHFKFDNSASGADTVTITLNTSAGFVGILIREIGGTSGFDTHVGRLQTGPGAGTDAVSTGNATPSVQPGLISAFAQDMSAFNTPAVGTGFTAGIAAFSGFGGAAMARSESKRYTSTAAQAATFTGVVSDDYVTLAAFFKESGGGAGLINASAGAYSWIGTTSTASGLIQAGIGAYSWVGTTSTTSSLINEAVGTYNWAATTSGLLQNVSSGVAAYSWAGSNSGLIQNISGLAGAYNWVGTSSSLTQLIAASTGAYTWAATTATFGAGAISAGIGAYAWSGTTSQVPTQISSDPIFGYVWSGSTATFGGQTPSISVPIAGALLPGVLSEAALRTSQEGRKPYPWQATGAPIVPSPFMGSSETLQPALHAAEPSSAVPSNEGAEPATAAPTFDEAQLLMIMLGSIL
jgi:hypothetical protein